MNCTNIEKLMYKGLDEAVFPGAVLLAAEKGRILFFDSYGYADIFSKERMRKDTIFDLASLTKPLATSLAIMKLIEDGKAELSTKVSEIIPEFYDKRKKNVTIANLLYHNSGLPDYRPYYMILEDEPYSERRRILRNMICSETLTAEPGKRELYSDIGFMLLAWLIEILSESRFDSYVHEIYNAFDIKMFFTDNDNSGYTKKFAATEKCLWRQSVLKGTVHDENAYIVGGAEGHAGLFGTALDIYNLLFMLISIYKGSSKKSLLKQETADKLFKRNSAGTRALGFDTPSREGSSCGKYFSYDSIGHLGFTGTSFWVDLDKEALVILLTNRIHPYRSNEKIRLFRPVLHDAVMINLSN